MAWPSGQRRPYSPEWSATKVYVKARAMGTCELVTEGTPCTRPGHEVDHIIPHHLGGDDSPSNAQLLCWPHHRDKTSAEARAERERIKALGYRAKERHPLDYD